MEQPIIFTLTDVLWLAGAIVAIASAVNVVAKAIEKMRKPNRTQDERLEVLEKRAKSDYERLERIEAGNVIMQRALLALLAHGIDGNDVEAMKRAKAELTDFLLER